MRELDVPDVARQALDLFDGGGSGPAGRATPRITAWNDSQVLVLADGLQVRRQRLCQFARIREIAVASFLLPLPDPAGHLRRRFGEDVLLFQLLQYRIDKAFPATANRLPSHWSPATGRATASTYLLDGAK
jgi:hypothetical protein